MKCSKCGQDKDESEFSQKARFNGQPACDECRAHAFRKNYKKVCRVCGQQPTVGDIRLCGPCCFGEAETVNGNW